MSQTFPIFVINLPRDADRRRTIEAHLTSLGAEFEVVPGIYGDDPRVTARYDEDLAYRDQGKPLTLGEKGCALAHASVYERIVQEKIPYAVILEDDVVLPKNFLELVEREIKRNHNVWDWLSFDYRYAGYRFFGIWFQATYETIKTRPFFVIYALLKLPYMACISLFESARESLARNIPSYRGAKFFFRPLYNAGAYVITEKGAKKLIPCTDPIRMSADRTPNVARVRSGFRLYGYVPLCVRQETSFGSNTTRPDGAWETID